MEDQDIHFIKRYDKREIFEYDEEFNRFSYVLYVVAFKLAVYATLYLLRLLMWNLDTGLMCFLDKCEND